MNKSESLISYLCNLNVGLFTPLNEILSAIKWPACHSANNKSVTSVVVSKVYN